MKGADPLNLAVRSQHKEETQCASLALTTLRDVEASSRWYQQLLGFQSGHGGPVQKGH